MALKILATGDIHIGKKSSGLPVGADEIATKYTWNRIIDRAIENEVDALLLTGDIIDQSNRYFEAIGPMQSGFEKLGKAGIKVYMVAGNHDYNVLSQMSTSGKYEHVSFLGANETWEMKIHSGKEGKLQFVGWSFANQYINEDPLLKLTLKDHDPDIPTIGLIHGDVDNPESRYAPVHPDGFLNKPVDAWILGHIHKPQIIREAEPIICYPGSPHSLSPKEQGVHGPFLLTIRSKQDIQLEQIPLSPVRYETLAIDISNTKDENSLRDAVTSGVLSDANMRLGELQKTAFLVYDVILQGKHNKIKEIESWIAPIVDDFEQELETETKISVRKVLINVQPQIENLEELALESSPAGIIAQTILAIRKGDTTPFLDRLLERWDRQYQDLRQAGTYKPLLMRDQDIRDSDTDPKQSILNECNLLLAELISQGSQ